MQESYITHIRVQEDGAYPQTPAPPSSPASNKKARIIMVSVRNTGRVKLHKARENANGTFSIGKSWPMEELSAMENYVYAIPNNEEEAQRQQWAGDKGFTVTIGKPYYWEAGTPKEKEFFIGSVVKIYHKYTKGNFPVLTGFGPAELSTLTNGQPHLVAGDGGTAATVPTREVPAPIQPRQATPEQRSLPPKSPGIPPRRPGESPLHTSEDVRRGPSPGANPNFRRNPGEHLGPRRPGQADDPVRNGSRPGTGDDSRRPPPFAPNQSTPPLPDLRQKKSIEQNMRSRPSGENMRMRAALGREPMPPTPSFPSQTLTPQSSTSELAGRPKTPESGNFPPSLSPSRRPQGEDAQSHRSQRSNEDLSINGPAAAVPPLEQRRQNGYPPPRRDVSPHSLRPGTAQSSASSNFVRSEDTPPEEPPQRRRPFMDSKPSLLSQRSNDSQDIEPRTVFHTPSQSPAPPIGIPPRRRPQEIPETTDTAPLEIIEPPKPRPTLSPQPPPPPASPLPKLPPTPTSQPPQPLETAPIAQPGPVEPEAAQNSISPTEEKDKETAHRPGLGPMIKKTIGSADAATKFRKAAAAAGAFKPRAGGAAAKLFSKDTKATDEPDGVSAVFVPQRPAPKETPKEEENKKIEETSRLTPDGTSKERPRVSTETIPSVKVSSPLTPIPDSATAKAEEQNALSTSNKTATKKAEVEREVRRKKRRSHQQIQNISQLGIDPSIIDERGLEFESLLSELGWGSRELTAKTIEALEADVKREIARVEAGSWLNHLEQKDDRVEAVERMLDRAIAECDELEGLLTLYNVELSVSDRA